VLVVDASAIGALVFGEQQAETVAAQLGEHPLAAPALIWFELASIALKKIKAYPAERLHILRALTLARSMAIRTTEVDQHEIIALAEQTGLTTYDSSYLWLARKLGGELVTLDQKLVRAAAGKLQLVP
jgi:predicted nucleic acid-binding protein